MREHETEQLVRDLTDRLEPVAPLPSLRAMLALLAGAGLAAILLDRALGLSLPASAAAQPWSELAFVTMLAAMCVAAPAGLVAGLAGAVPGRERLARLGGIAAAVALLAVAGAAVWGLGSMPYVGDTPFERCAACVGRAAAIGLLPGMVAFTFTTGGWPPRTWPALWICLGVGSLGAAVVHTTCLVEGAKHMLVGHALAPFVVGFAIGIPLAWLGLRAPRRGASV